MNPSTCPVHFETVRNPEGALEAFKRQFTTLRPAQKRRRFSVKGVRRSVPVREVANG